ncbi:MAG TPA: DUF167 domain-containing protein [Thermopetrobacter sp.]|nr:DUF167 domain-containing protein [Thermopetrobacter sp.]
MEGDFFHIREGRLLVRVRLTPNARRDAVAGVRVDAAGEAALRLKVRAVPEKGRANQAAVALLAKWLKVAKSRIGLHGGATSRTKTFAIAGPLDDVLPALRAMTEADVNEEHSRP